jgi:membrane associated rhomboid family serine protease/Zn-finger nucleic acid-binding protein
MFRCPLCQTHLVRVKSSHGMLWGCPDCQGRSAGLGILRQMMRKESINALWMSARDQKVDAGPPCPLCANAMATVPRFEGLEVDVCTTCQNVWFDPSELESAIDRAPAPVPRGDADLSPEARELLALAKIQAIRERAEAENDNDGTPPAEGWQTVLTLFGIPVEQDAPSLSRWPWVTWLTLLLMAATAFWTFNSAPETYRSWGLLPNEPWRHGGLSFVTSFFLHADWWHLVGNAAFLYVFGDNVEDFLGHWRYILLLVLSAICGDAIHLVFAPRGDLPLIGASGGISGVIVFYALAFPRARLVYFLRVGFYFRWVRFPAWGGLIMWILLQVVGAFQQLAGHSHVSSLGHLGGAVAGVGFWLVMRRTLRPVTLTVE